LEYWGLAEQLESKFQGGKARNGPGIWVSLTYSGSNILAKSCVTCYLPLKSRDLKSYDMQKIHALLRENFKVMTLAR